MLSRYFSAFLVLFAMAKPAMAGKPVPPEVKERYYVVLFAYQDEPNRMSNSHTFATFVKETTVGNGKPALEQKTISWIPADYAEVLTIDHTKTVKGKNFTLDETLSAVARANAKWRDAGDPTRMEVKSYGAYPLTKENFDKAGERIKALESGKIAYKMIDIRSRNRIKNEAVNCIHSVSDIIPGLGTGTSRGYLATEKVRDHFAAHGYINPAEEDLSLVQALLKATREIAGEERAPVTPDTH